jgi:hypothetical protein
LSIEKIEKSVGDHQRLQLRGQPLAAQIEIASAEISPNGT